jgi:ABC-type branched-subunit amino acid transport system permease subunit
MSAYEISVLSVIGLNVILAVSLNMISGFCGQISLGHGAFYGAGAYAAALTMIATGVSAGARLRDGAARCSASWSALLRCACAAIFSPSPRSA